MNSTLPTISEPDPQWMATLPSPSASGLPCGSRRLHAFVRRFWWIPLLTLLSGASIGTAYVLKKAPSYSATARMWVTGRLTLPQGVVYTEDLQNFVGTQIELLQSLKVQNLALGRLRGTNPKAVPVDKDGMAMAVQTRIVQSPKSTVFAIQATSADSAYSQAYLNALMDEFLAYKRDVRKSASGDTLASVAEQVNRLEQELKIEQDNLSAFKRTNNLAVLQEQGAMGGSYLTKLTAQLSDLKLEGQLLEATALEQKFATETKSQGGSLLSEAGRGANPSSFSTSLDLQTARKQVDFLKIQREQLSQYLRPKHPKIVKLNDEIERGTKLIELAQSQSREQLEAARQAVRLRIDSVVASLKEWEAKVVDANFRIAEADRLKGNVQRIQSFYDRLLPLLQSVDMSRSIDQETVTILDRASDARRSYRRELMVLAASGIGGVICGLGIIYLIATRDQRLLSIRELNELIGENIVGQVPEMNLSTSRERLALLEINDNRHIYAEAYRSLRSALLFMPSRSERPKVLLVTSAVPNEGKSTVSANLARILAFGGAKVLLVDGDLRKGILHDMMGMRREPGLVELLQSPDEACKIIQSDSVSNLHFLGTGNLLAYTGETFLSPRFEALLSRLRQQFDYVVIDSTPVFAADDAATLAPQVDGVLLVVRNSFTSLQPLREAIELLYQRQAHVLGLVFNRADASAHSYYYYKHPEYFRTAVAG